METIDLPILLLIAVVAFFYSSVGHAGASGYIAALTLAGWSAAQVRPLALILNLFVAAITTIKFYRAGHFRLAMFLPLVILAVPAAAIGGHMQISTVVLSRFIGLVLCCSAIWLIAGKREPELTTPPGNLTAVLTGGAIGLLAGLSGTGGGIFLSPMMLYLRWARLRQIAATAAPFILVNSVAGLAGMNYGGFSLPAGWLLYVLVSIVGGFFGSTIGANYLQIRVIQMILSFVISIAGLKLLLIF